MPSKTRRRDAGAGSIYEDIQGRWCAVLELPEHGGKRRRKVARRSTKAAATEALRIMRKELDRTGDLPTASPTLGAWLTRWLEVTARPRLKPRTLATYRGYVNGRIIPSIGKIRLDKLAVAHIERLHADLAADPNLSSTTALQIHRILSKALADAERQGAVSRNVAELVDAPRRAVAVRPALTADDAKALLNAINQDPLEAAMWGCALIAGLRQGERLGLTREQINLERGTLTVAWQVQRLAWEHGCKDSPCGRKRANECPSRHVDIPADQEAKRVYGGLWMTRPKSRAGWREVPLPVELWNALTAYLAVVEPGDAGLIFTDEKGHPLDPRKDSEAWDALLRRVGLPDVPLHSARHTANTLLHSLGVDDETRQKIMGHSSAVVNAGYVHLSDAMTRDAMDRLGAFLAEPRQIGGAR